MRGQKTDSILVATVAVGYSLRVYKRFFLPFCRGKLAKNYSFILFVDEAGPSEEIRSWVSENCPFPVTYRPMLGLSKGSMMYRRFSELSIFMEELYKTGTFPDYVFFTDFRDVLFLNDIYVPEAPEQRFVCFFKEDIKLKESKTVTAWLRKSYSEQEIPRSLEELPVYCPGNLFGDFNSLRSFLIRFCNEMLRVAKNTGLGPFWGIDIASLFFLAHVVPPVENIFIIQNSDGKFLTASARGSWRVSVLGKLLSNKTGKEFCFVHMIDRFKFTETLRLAFYYDLSLLNFAWIKIRIHIKGKWDEYL